MANATERRLSAAQRAGQELKDSNAQKRKSDVGKRSDYGGSISSGSSSNLSINSLNRINNTSIRNNLSSSISKNSDAQNRIKRNQQIEKISKVAEKIPVLNKYAKVARLAKKVNDTKNRKSGIMGKLFGNNDSKPTMSEIEDANASEAKGEEYNPEDSDGKYTVKLLDKRTKIIFLSIILGFAGACIFLCIILAAAITGGGKESYLASHENATEEELEEAYNSSEDDGDDSSDSSSDSNSDSDSSGSYSTGNIKSGSTSNIIMVGDSRTVGLCSAVYNGSNCETLGYKNGKNTFIAKTSMGYDWLNNTAGPSLKNKLKENSKSTVFINLGTNDLFDAEKYAKYYNQLAKDYKDANIIAVSVTPIIDSEVQYAPETENDANVVKFNKKLKSKLSQDVVYCDAYSQVKGKVKTTGDGVHYDNQSYKLIDNAMKNCLKGSSSTNNTSFAGLLSKGKTSTEQLKNKNIKQLIIVDSNGSNANVYFYENINNEWKIDSTLNATGHVGEGGTIEGDKHSENTKKTPAGLYEIGDAFYQTNNAKEPKTGLNILKITSNTYWIDDPNSKYYNKHAEGNNNKDWNSYEDMSNIKWYKYGFVIRFNMDPIVKNKGSAIFFHIDHNSATSGCVSVSEDKVLAYLKKLDKNKKPYILII